MPAAEIPFHTFLWKIASRCNLNCTYCFVYNSVDQLWRRQPVFMSREVARQAARRMREHLASHGRDSASVVFHGGEPLLAGRERLSGFMAIVEEELVAHGIAVEVGIQSNLVLLDEELCDWLREHEIKVGVSLDGPPAVNDRHRVDHAGRGTSARVEDGLRLLTRPEYRASFGGILSVIDLDVPPEPSIDYFASWDPPSIDFLLPLNNHTHRPPGKGLGEPGAPYGEWLVRAFEHAGRMDRPVPIRLFESILRLLVGRTSLVEALGLSPVDLVVVEANGAIEAVDSLKTTFEGATALGLDVFANSFDEAAATAGVRQRQLGAAGLCATCRECDLVNVCGGGYLPTRWSHAGGFDNPSVYCEDLMTIIRHIAHRLASEMGLLEPEAVGG